MSLARWNPFRELEELFNAHPRGLSRSLLPQSQELLAASDWSPAVDISETAEAYVIKAELAGVKREDIKVTLDHGVLTLRGERKLEKEDKDEKHHRIERFHGTFARSFVLPEDADEADIKAEYAEGVLTLSLPKHAGKPSPRREISIGG